MNTIDNRPRLAFGMRITPRAEELILAETKNLIGATATEVVGKGKKTRNIQKPILENIKGLLNHKKTDDLTLDTFVDGNGKYHALVKFTNGPAIKKAVSYDFEGDKLGFSLSFINKQKLKLTKPKLKERYLTAKVELARKLEFDNFINSKKFQARFSGDTASLIRKVEGDYSIEDLKKLILEAPERFIFKVVHEKRYKNFGNLPFQREIAERENNKFKLYVATKEYPKFEEFTLDYPKTIAKKAESGGTCYNKNVYDIKADLLKFEKMVLKPNHVAAQKEVQAVINAKAKLEAAFKKSKGLNFTEAAKHYILESNELTSEQFKKLSELAKRESSKDFTLNMRVKNAGYLGDTPYYHAHISSKNTEECFVNESTLKETVNRILNIKMASLEENVEARLLREEQQKLTASAFKLISDTEGYENKFDKYAKVLLDSNKDFLYFDNLKDIIENTPKIKILRDERSGDRYHSVLKVAHDDYPKAGFMTIDHDSSFYQLMNRTSAKKINDFAQTTLKKAHEEAVKVDAVRDDLANFFAQARANKK